MSNKVFVILAIAIVVAVAIGTWRARIGAIEPRSEIRRDAFVVPQPTEHEKLAYLFDLFISGRSLVIGSDNYPIWRILGENTFLRIGDSALDYLLDPARFATYRASPNILINVFRLLLAAPEAITRPQ